MDAHGAIDHPERPIIRQIVEALQERVGPPPEVVVVLGSGLGGLAGQVEGATHVAYSELGLPQPKVAGHAGELVVGTLGGTRVGLLRGRVHLYEGWHPWEVVRGVRAMHQWGVGAMLLTASVGSIRLEVPPGRLVALSDFINLQWASPLVGPPWANRFPDVSHACAPAVRAALAAAAAEIAIPWSEGVYGAMRGPAYETPAEIRMLRTLGCDVVGMSVVAELLAGAEVGLPMGAVAVVTNFAAGVAGEEVGHAGVLRAAAAAADDLSRLLAAAAPRVAAAALRPGRA